MATQHGCRFPDEACSTCERDMEALAEAVGNGEADEECCRPGCTAVHYLPCDADCPAHAETCGAVDPEDLDACGSCSDCNPDADA